MKRSIPLALAAPMAFVFTWMLAATVRADQTPAVPVLVPAADQTIMPMSEVRVGMKGYGMSVFHGTAIEPFPVEVVSIISDSSPKRGTIWVQCTDDRMRQAGPVQGMSGSPIYLWEEGEAGEIGQGGRLIGAFAFGYRLSKECIVGVQPIELMREIATRKDDLPPDAVAGSWERARTTLAQLDTIAQSRRAPASVTWRAKLLGDVVGVNTRGLPLGDSSRPASTSEPQALMLPLNVGPTTLADAVRPLFEPMGLSPVAGDTLAGPPPVGIDPAAVKLAPGSVLAVPIVFGDMDLAASGTVTDVLHDGTVLGFGHSMFGEGATALPMATGYVHYVLPSVDISFKRTGSLNMVGSLVRDEESGVLGTEKQHFVTVPVTVDVQHIDGPAESFSYEMAYYRPLAPQIAATVVLRSLVARHSIPFECTMDLDATLDFEGGYSFHVAGPLAGGDITAPLYELLPALMLMTENPFETKKLTALHVSLKVRPGIDAAAVVGSSIDHAEVAPGGTIRVTLDLQPQNGERTTLTGSITIPLDTPEGDYGLLVGGGSTYAAMINKTFPQRSMVNSIDDLAQLLKDAYAIPANGAYIMLERDGGGIAVGRTELPDVPSSRAAILTSPTQSFAVPFGKLTVSRIDTPLTLTSQAAFQISVRKGAFGSPAEAD